MQLVASRKYQGNLIQKIVCATNSLILTCWKSQLSAHDGSFCHTPPTGPTVRHWWVYPINTHVHYRPSIGDVPPLKRTPSVHTIVESPRWHHHDTYDTTNPWRHYGDSNALHIA